MGKINVFCSFSTLNDFIKQNKIMAKSLFPKQSKWILGLVCLFILTSCTRQEGAKVEAFFFNLLSMIGLMSVEVLLLVIVTMTKVLTNNNNYGTTAKTVSWVLFAVVFIILFIWTNIIVTDWMHSAPYRYGEGVVMVWGMYFIAIISTVAAMFFVKNNTNKS